MTSGPEAGDAAGPPEADVMARYGIRLVTANHYYIDGYHYTVLADAVDQAKRREALHAVKPREQPF